ncbi:MAG: DALR anticodon-binding domain-containing protein, partial [Candidatus Syntropharchaeia archaeon]
EEEKKLLNKFLEVKDKVKKALDHLNYKEAVRNLIELKPFIDSYFDNVFVMVNQEDIRLNRLGFLKNVDDLFMEIGDLSYLIKRE